ncbi:hypothetical protein D3C85_1330330 [compost metagenome]
MMDQRSFGGDVGGQPGEGYLRQEGADEHYRGGRRQLPAQAGQGVQRPCAIDRPLPVERGQVQAIGQLCNASVRHQITHRAHGCSLFRQPRQIVRLGHITGDPRQLSREALRQFTEAADLA